jgi:hypothetical protein
MMTHFTRRNFLQTGLSLTAAGALAGNLSFAEHGFAAENAPVSLLGNRFLTLNAVIRVNQIEAARDKNLGADEANCHKPEGVQAFRDAIAKGWPGGKITWAFSWLALQDQRENYRKIREMVVGFHKKYGDEITFIPGGYFANMYSPRLQVNKDLHDALAMVSKMVGDGYRPKSVVAGFLAAENLRYLAEEEGIHVCQGNIWSQYAVDNGDGEGSVCYPYYPSKEHFCKPAQNKTDFIDCVNLDGWTVDFLAGRRAGFAGGFNSRLGVGPIETLYTHGTKKGLEEILATTAAHFDQGFALNDFAWICNCWEVSLPQGAKTPDNPPDNGLKGLVQWLSETRRRWPKAMLTTQGEFGLAWRDHFQNNDDWNYRFVERGTGIGGSDKNMEIRWFMNKDFRLALLRDWQANGPEMVIDFTRYDVPSHEPKDLGRNWSLMNRINQKQSRPQDKPVLLKDLPAEDRELIGKRYPDLLK